MGIPLGRFAAKTLHYAHQNGHLLSNANLLKIIHDKLLFPRSNGTQLLFATLAENHLVVDPFVPNYKQSKNPQMMEYDTVHPDYRIGWYPSYVDLCQLDSVDEALEVLRRTSAIPFFLESGITKGGDVVVDGGIVDNMPILPVLESGVDYVIVVWLSPIRASRGPCSGRPRRHDP